MEICKRCKLAKKCSASSEIDVCLNYEPRQQTNYDRIISKTPEEMAELIGDNIDCSICKEKYSADGCPRTVEKDCYGVWLDWLKAPVEEVDE